jgi:Glycosyl transferase family 90
MARRWLAAFLLCLQHVRLSAQFAFAFRNQSLYTNIIDAGGDRAQRVILSLLTLAASRTDVPDVLALYANGIIDDDLKDCHPSDLSTWRPPGAKAPLLFSDFDMMGYADNFIPPLQTIMDAYEHEQPSWSDRAEAAFWSGSFSGGGGLREAYVDCARAHPAHVRADVVEYGWAGPIHGPFGIDTKPVASDLRKLWRHKYVVYMRGNSWSTSLKRILASGAVVFLPEPMEHESLESLIFRRGCKDCALTYRPEPEHICASLLAGMRNLSDAEAEARAARTRAFVFRELAVEKVWEIMITQLRKVAAAPAFQLDAVAEEWVTTTAHPTFGVLNLTRTSCASMLKYFSFSAHPWQMEAWFDSECRLRRHAKDEQTYLDFTAI